MEKRDVYRFGTLRQRATGHPVTVLAIDNESVQFDNWNTRENGTLPLESFLKEYEPMHAPSGLPRYAVAFVEPAPGFSRTARVCLIESEPAFCDECGPLLLHAKPDGLALLDTYLRGLATGETWLSREADGLAERNTQPLQEVPTREASLNEATTSSRYPGQWLMLLVDTETQEGDHDEDDLMEICFRDEHLAQDIFNAVVAGAIRLER